MKAIVYELTAPRTLARRESELDEDVLAPDQILAATEFSLVSPGTELAAWMGKPPLRPSKAYPRLLGYCNVARVLRVGRDVKNVAIDDYVLTHQSHCSHFRCLQTEILLAERGLDVEARRKLTSTYLYHLGYIALLNGGYIPGYEVAIVGLGALGLTTASLALAFGGEPVVLTGCPPDLIPACLAGARILPKSAPSAGRWPSRSGLEGADLVVNTSDAWSDYLLCLQIARKGGTVALLGFPGRGQPLLEFNPLNTQYLYDKQLTIKQVGHVPELNASAIDVRFTIHRNLRYLRGLILRGVVDPTPLLTTRASWCNLSDVYATLATRQYGSYTALIEWTC